MSHASSDFSLQPSRLLRWMAADLVGNVMWALGGVVVLLLAAIVLKFEVIGAISLSGLCCGIVFWAFKTILTSRDHVRMERQEFKTNLAKIVEDMHQSYGNYNELRRSGQEIWMKLSKLIEDNEELRKTVFDLKADSELHALRVVQTILSARGIAQLEDRQALLQSPIRRRITDHNIPYTQGSGSRNRLQGPQMSEEEKIELQRWSDDGGSTNTEEP